MTGLKLQYFYFSNTTGNAVMTISDGASNGYNVFGDASGQVTIDDGCAVAGWMNDKLADVASGVKTIDLAGTGTESIDIMLVFG